MIRKAVTSVVGVLVLLAVIELVGRLQLAGSTWPPLTDVVSYALNDPGRQIIGRAVQSTLLQAASGLLYGTIAGLLGAAIGILVPWLRPGMSQLAILLSTIPLIALGPILVTSIGSDATPQAIAALGAGFAIFVAMSSAFIQPTGSLDDLFTVLGSSRAKNLTRLRLPAAIPAFFDGLALAAPSALLGAVVGEWFGAPRGIGVLLVTSMQNYAIDQLWAAAFCLSIVSLVVYGSLVAIRQVAVRRFA